MTFTGFALATNAQLMAATVGLLELLL